MLDFFDIFLARTMSVNLSFWPRGHIEGTVKELARSKELLPQSRAMKNGPFGRKTSPKPAGFEMLPAIS